jgi:hypothetical protein
MSSVQQTRDRLVLQGINPTPLIILTLFSFFRSPFTWIKVAARSLLSAPKTQGLHQRASHSMVSISSILPQNKSIMILFIRWLRLVLTFRRRVAVLMIGVQNVLEGYNGTVFAYGQTGSGKTFSMQGDETTASQRGIIPRTFEHIFEATATTDNSKFLVHGSYLEVECHDVIT